MGDAAMGNQPFDGKRLVGLAYPFKRRRLQRRFGLRQPYFPITARTAPGGEAEATSDDSSVGKKSALRCRIYREGCLCPFQSRVLQRAIDRRRVGLSW